MTILDVIGSSRTKGQCFARGPKYGGGHVELAWLHQLTGLLRKSTKISQVVYAGEEWD